jgi:hypothetical protein
MGGGDRKAREHRKRIANGIAASGSTSRNTTGIAEALAPATADICVTAPVFRVPVIADGRRLTATAVDFGRNTSC